jgi:hypothetical protein
MKSIEQIAAESAKHVKPGQSFGDLCAENAWPLGWDEMMDLCGKDPDLGFSDEHREQLLARIREKLPTYDDRLLIDVLEREIFHVLIAHEECAYQLGKAVGKRESHAARNQ